MSAVELSLTDVMDKLVVDDWGQCRSGPFGSLRAHVDAGKPSENTLSRALGERRRWHALGEDALRRARRDRRGSEAGARARGRDDPVLASRPEPQRHRPG